MIAMVRRTRITDIITVTDRAGRRWDFGPPTQLVTLVRKTSQEDPTLSSSDKASSERARKRAQSMFRSMLLAFAGGFAVYNG